MTQVSAVLVGVAVHLLQLPPRGQAAVEAYYTNDYLRQQAEPQPLLPQEAGGRWYPRCWVGRHPR